MELRVLQYFLAVAREQNITAAAESLHLSQPTLSTQLKAMEEELGKQLLVRGTKAVSYTHLDVYKRQLLPYPFLIVLQYSLEAFRTLGQRITIAIKLGIVSSPRAIS